MAYMERLGLMDSGVFEVQSILLAGTSQTWPYANAANKPRAPFKVQTPRDVCASTHPFVPAPPNANDVEASQGFIESLEMITKHNLFVCGHRGLGHHFRGRHRSRS